MQIKNFVTVQPTRYSTQAGNFGTQMGENFHQNSIEIPSVDGYTKSSQALCKIINIDLCETLPRFEMEKT